MGLLDGIEKLINEHGSSAILRERIALANDKYAALEAKMRRLESEKVELERENGRLRVDLHKTQEQVRNLEGQLKQPISEAHGKTLSNEQRAILLLLMKEPADESEVIKALGRGGEAIRFDLVELAGAGLIEHRNLFGMGTLCSLTQEGRRYLKSNGLLT